MYNVYISSHLSPDPFQSGHTICQFSIFTLGFFNSLSQPLLRLTRYKKPLSHFHCGWWEVGRLAGLIHLSRGCEVGLWAMGNFHRWVFWLLLADLGCLAPSRLYCYFISCIFTFTPIYLSLYFVLTALLQGQRIILSRLSELIKSSKAFKSFLISKGSWVIS